MSGSGGEDASEVRGRGEGEVGGRYVAELESARGDIAGALANLRRATAAILSHRAAEMQGIRDWEKTGGLVEQRAIHFHHHVANLAQATRKSIEPLRARFNADKGHVRALGLFAPT